MTQALPDHAHDKPIEIWFQDEARIGQKGTLTRIWACVGSRPRAPRDSRYEWAYLFGAVCHQRAVGAALVLPYADSQAMNLHLREIGRAVAPGRTCRPRPRRRRRAHHHDSQAAQQRLLPVLADLLCAGVEPRRESLGVLAQEQTRLARL